MVHSPGEIVENDDLFSDDQDNSNHHAKRPRIQEAGENQAAETAGEPSLHDLIDQKEWNRLVRRVEELRRRNVQDNDAEDNDARIPELHETKEIVPALKGFTPLQCALQAEATAGVIDALVDAHTVQVRHEFLHSPLFRACEYLRDPACIRKIIDSYPKAILEKQEGMSVFHVVLQYKPPLHLVEYMVQVWAEQQGVDIDTAWTEIVKDRDGGGMLPIHYSVQEHAASDVTLKLLEKYPDSAIETINGKRSGLSTVHHAVYHGCSYEVLSALVEHGVGALSNNRGQGNRKKTTPLHLLFHMDKKERWLKDKASPDVMSPYKMAWFLIMKHAKHAKEELGGKKADPKKLAKELVFKTRDEGNCTVFERAAALEAELDKVTFSSRDYQDLRDIRHDFGIRVDLCREFPNISFEDKRAV